MIITQLGTAKVDITPLEPVELSGFGNRHGPFESISQRLYARVWLFEQNAPSSAEKRRVLLVQADIICWPSERIDILRRLVREQLDIAEDCIILHASHTHGGPQTTTAFLERVGIHSPAYTELLESRLLEGVRAAARTLEPVTMERERGACFFNIHRRARVNGEIMNAPNPDVPVDREVTVARFRTETGATKGVFFHFTCHPTTTNSRKVTSEYPGAAMERLEQALDGASALFLQGCCGDVRPALHTNGRFYAGSDDDVSRLGGELADEVLRVLESPMEDVPLGPIESRSAAVELPFESLPAVEQLSALSEQTDLLGDWSRKMLAAPELIRPSIPLHLSLIRLGERFGMLTLDGEVVQRYGDLIKERSRGDVLPLAYSNGMIGYVPTAVQVDEGGYEGRTSFPLFSLPAAFERSLEQIICEGIEKLLDS